MGARQQAVGDIECAMRMEYVVRDYGGKCGTVSMTA